MIRLRATRPLNRLGFALPMVIIVIFVLAGGLAAGFAMTRSERAIDDALRADSYAQTNAETALQRALTDRAGLGLAAGTPPATDSVRLTETNGYADVIVTRLRPVVGTESAVYLIRSHGFSTASRVSGTPAAEYTVTQLATWQRGTITVQAAFTSLTGIIKNGTTGTIDGRDDCGVKSALPAVAVPQVPGYTQSGGSISSVLLGGPPLIDSTQGATPAAMAPNVPIDWASIVAGTALTPDFTSDYLGNGFPSSAYFSANPNSYPIIYVNNDSLQTFDVPRVGRGMLIVRWHMTISGSDTWNGIVLVGGTITSNGNNTISGAAVTGLNVKLGSTVATNSVGNGNKDFSYDSCMVENSVSGLGRMKVYKATWGNNYAVY